MSEPHEVPTAIPALADVVKDRSLLSRLSVQVLAGYVVGLAAVQQELGAALAVAERGEAPPPADRTLTIEEAAEKYAIAPGTLKRWLRHEPYNAAAIVLSRTVVRVSAQRLEQVLIHEGSRRRDRRPVRVPGLGTGLLEGRHGGAP